MQYFDIHTSYKREWFTDNVIQEYIEFEFVDCFMLSYAIISLAFPR